MIDWYSILFFAAGIIIYCLDRVVNHRSVADYFLLSAEFGIQQGTVLLWTSLFTAWTFILGIYASFHFGLGYSILFCLLFYILVYLFLARVVPDVRRKAGKTLPYGLPDLYRDRFSGKGRGMAGILLAFMNMDGLFIQPVLAAWLFQLWFDQHVALFIGLLFLFAVILAGLGGMAVLTDAISILLTVCGGVLVFLPLLLYVRRGIDQVYDTYQQWSVLHSPHINDILLFSMLLLFWGLAKCSTSIFLWRTLLSLKAPHYSSSIKLAVAGGGAFAVALLTYFIYIGSENPRADWYGVIENLIEHQGELTLSLAICIWLIAVAFSMMVSLYSMSSLLAVYWQGARVKFRMPRFLYFFVLILSMVAGIWTYYLYEYGPEIIFSYFLFIAYIALPSFGILQKQSRLPAWVAVAVMVIPAGLVLIYCAYHASAFLYGGFVVSGILALLICSFNFSEN